ncbi:MAG: hypothetical protein ACODAU_04395 [Myxococcota bacterium]
MDSELGERRRRRAFQVHVGLFLGGAIAGALGLGGTWRAGIAAAGVCWVAAGVLAFVARRSVLAPQALRGAADAARDDPGRRADVERAGALMGGIVLVLVGGTTAVLGFLWLGRALSG